MVIITKNNLIHGNHYVFPVPTLTTEKFDRMQAK